MADIVFTKQTIPQPAVVRWTSPDLPNAVAFVEGNMIVLAPTADAASWIVRVPKGQVRAAIAALTAIGTELGTL